MPFLPDFAFRLFVSFENFYGINFCSHYLTFSSMIRRLSALFFLIGMMALVFFQQPALAYCTHTDQFFVSNCGCEEQVQSQCSHCQEEKPSDPCDDCSEKIQLDVDDLVWFDLSIQAPAFVSSPVVDGEVEAINFPTAIEFSPSPIRPPPPPGGVPLFLLHSVFRL